MPLYRILWSAPVTERHGPEDHEGKKPHRVICWPCRAEIEAKDEFAALQQAKTRFGGSPVIERAQEIHYV